MTEITTFTYTDSKGVTTVREISNARQDGHYLRGFDVNEKGVRTFRLDRIHWGDGVPDVTPTDEPLSLTALAKASKKGKPTVCFTGFSRDAALPHLRAMAENAGMVVAKSVVSKLTYLVTGANAGPAKLDKAAEEGSAILTEDEFINLMETGELPDAVKWEKLPNPEQYFAGWHYTIHRALWSALGVQMREFVNRERTALWRHQWEQDNPRYGELKPEFFKQNAKKTKGNPNLKEWESLKQERANLAYKDRFYAKSVPRLYDFHEGDVFHCPQGDYLQVVKTVPTLEVKYAHNGSIHPYHIPPALLADWLQFGTIPDDG